MYLLYNTRPNITFAIGQLSKKNSESRLDYIRTIKKIVYYLKDTMHLGLIYRSQIKNKKKIKASIKSSLFKLVRYRDSSYTRDPKNKKLIIRYYYFINGAIVSWCIK